MAHLKKHQHCHVCILVLWCLVLWCRAAAQPSSDQQQQQQQDEEEQAHRIAIVGGSGLTGTFVAKYLADLVPSHDNACSLQAVTLFDPFAPGSMASSSTTTTQHQHYQPSRVYSFQQQQPDKVVELGFSQFTSNSVLIRDMAEAGNLTLQSALDSLHLVLHDETLRLDLPVVPRAQSTISNLQHKALSKRYGSDWKLLMDQLEIMRIGLARIQDHLKDTSEEYIFSIPKEIFQAAGNSFLEGLLDESFQAYCDRIGIGNHNEQGWFSYLFSATNTNTNEKGSIQDELLAATLRSQFYLQHLYNSKNVTALSGLFALSLLVQDAFQVQGGNSKLAASAWNQAQDIFLAKCGAETTSIRLSHQTDRVSTIVGSLEGFEIYSSTGSFLGDYDIVILATPLPMAGIDFLIKSHIDDTVLQPMPLGGLVANEDVVEIPKHHEGHSPLPQRLPDAFLRPYASAVITLLRNAELNKEYFGTTIDSTTSSSTGDEKEEAQLILVPEKVLNSTISSIWQTGSDIRVSSAERLPLTVLQDCFGSQVQVDYVHEWAGRHGGFTPDLTTSSISGLSSSTDFLLFDGATGFHGHTKSGALYYPSAMEVSLFGLEGNAMSARAVAKLIAHRLDWIQHATTTYGMEEEL